MANTVVGLFPTVDKAKDVKKALESNGFDSNDVSVIGNDGSNSNEGVGEKISNFFRSLTGGDDRAHHHYAQGVNGGGALVAVHCNDGRASEVAAMLQEHGATNIDGDSDADSGYSRAGSSYAADGADYAAGSMNTGYASDDVGDGYATDRSRSGYDTASATGETAIPIVAEELLVGKREVDRGGVRVYSRTVETPVDTDVTLRDERINIERRPADRAATAADFRSGGVIELNATGEEAVVGKSARVIEEVLVGKQSSQHTEAIHDSVRKTEVEIEPVGADFVTSDRR